MKSIDFMMVIAFGKRMDWLLEHYEVMGASFSGAHWFPVHGGRAPTTFYR